MTRRIQSSLASWLSDGTGGVRLETGLRDFPMIAGYPSERTAGSIPSVLRGRGAAVTDTKQPAPGFVVLRLVEGNAWEMLGEVQRRRGLPARAARSQAILDATDGAARPGEVYAAVLRSEWRVSLDWEHPSA
jgi:hypothetical protein